MTRILFITNALDESGWSRAGHGWALALDAAGYEVVVRPLILSDAKVEPPGRVRDLMNRPAEGCDVVVQHVLPHLSSYDGNFVRNICLFVSETSSFGEACWADRLNCMDECWVASRHQLEACRASGVTVPLKVVPHAIDLSRFQRSYPVFDKLRGYREAGDFVFYSIGEFVTRKGWSTLLRAYLTEFGKNEAVRLVIKTSLPGVPKDDTQRRVGDVIQAIANGLKLHGLPTVSVITDRLSEDEICQLHATADCFVTASYAESCCLPALESMAAGRTPIVPASSGFLEWANEDVSYLVPTRAEPCFGVYDTFEDLYTGRENWWVPDQLALQKAMRNAFEDSSARRAKAMSGIRHAYNFSHDAVGRVLRAALDGQTGAQLEELAGSQG